MSRVIRRREILEDDWTLAVDALAQRTAGKLIVPLARWRAEHAALLASAAAVGVLLPNTEDIEAVYPLVADRPLIALQFPTFTDGRALTQAVLLRNRLGYTGELRALGDVVRDLAFWLARCGFDALVPRPDQDLHACRQALDEIRVAYQPAADAHAPVWVRRRAPAAG
jgi:uncharacterized protein (DUF934 family)